MRTSALAAVLAVLLPAFSLAAKPAKPAAKAAASAVEPRHADHEALRALREKVTEALEKRDFDALAPLLASRFSIVTIDQKRYTDLAALKAAYEDYFGGEHPLVKSATFKPEADELTRFVAPDVGLADGTSQDTYTFADGDVKTMLTRWSAVVVKEKGAWKLASLHTAGNIFDNPLLGALKAKLAWAAVFAALAGLGVGFVGARLSR